MPVTSRLRVRAVRVTARRERGASAVVVAILLIPVLFGALSISMDIGQIYAEKRQLQNGADAAALSAARRCAESPSDCSPSSAPSTNLANDLTALAGSNANDGATTVTSICGNAAARALSTFLAGQPACSTPATPGQVDCPAPPSSLSTSVPYVEVRTRTLTAGGADSLTAPIASAIAGAARETPVGSCARAAWGSPGSGTATLPIAISGCDWMHATGGTPGGGGGSYYASPVYAPGGNADGYGVLSAGQAAWPAAPATPPAQNLGGEVILLVQNPPGGATPASACPAPPSSGAWSGHALPGGFGLLETLPGQPCQIKEYANHWMHTDPGSSTGCDLEQHVGKVVNLPIFDCTASGLPSSEPPVGTCTAGSGSHAHYHRAGYAAFYLSGYSVTTSGSVLNKKKSVNPNFNAFPCSGPNRCISGWFITGSLSATAISGPPSGGGYFGTYTAVPAG